MIDYPNEFKRIIIDKYQPCQGGGFFAYREYDEFFSFEGTTEIQAIKALKRAERKRDGK